MSKQRNVELFDKVADLIEQNPKLYDQTTIGSVDACGTKHCVAGWTAVALGIKPRSCNFYAKDDGVWSWTLENGRPIDHFAAEHLGLEMRDCWVDDDDRIDRESEEIPPAHLFDSTWTPPEGETVPQALRRIGRGGAI